MASKPVRATDTRRPADLSCASRVSRDTASPSAINTRGPTWVVRRIGAPPIGPTCVVDRDRDEVLRCTRATRAKMLPISRGGRRGISRRGRRGSRAESAEDLAQRARRISRKDPLRTSARDLPRSLREIPAISARDHGITFRVARGAFRLQLTHLRLRKWNSQCR